MAEDLKSEWGVEGKPASRFSALSQMPGLVFLFPLPPLWENPTAGASSADEGFCAEAHQGIPTGM